MDDCPEAALKSICCCCLSVDRKLYQLCKITDGVNNLFFLLSCDLQAYEDLFNKNAVMFFICWECKALMKKFFEFRNQACTAQKYLSEICDGRVKILSQTKCLSNLSINQTENHKEFVSNNDLAADNFIDCGLDIDFIKTESDTDDIPLSELNNSSVNIKSIAKNNINKKKDLNTKIDINHSDYLTEKLTEEENKSYTTVKMSEDEMYESIERRRLAEDYIDSPSKCESCVQGFKDDDALRKHNSKLHVQLHKHIQCDICQAYIKYRVLEKHRSEHFLKYLCSQCDYTSYSLLDIIRHLRQKHCIKIAKNVVKKRSKSKKNEVVTDETTPQGYMCVECNKYFENKSKRYKHVQKAHRPGHRCTACGKTFAFRSSLSRHERVHQASHPRTQCPACGKLVRADLVVEHARIHEARARAACVPCGKRFVSRASYHHHLMYAAAHARQDVLKHKCSLCEKGYRSSGELRDHINYQHLGRTKHKCPICDKDKKSLREHELIHTGERPLSCDTCGRTFRQQASLYTHRRRVHNVAPKARVLSALDEDQ